MTLSALTPDARRPQVEVQQTTFAHDVVGRWVANTWTEAIQNGGRPFDTVVIGGGMHGGYCAEKLYRYGEGIGLRVLVLDAGPLLATTHLQNLPGIGLTAASPAAVILNSQDRGPRNVVWGIPWHSGTAFPGLAYCIGGRSLFWGGWHRTLLEYDTSAVLLQTKGARGPFSAVDSYHRPDDRACRSGQRTTSGPERTCCLQVDPRRTATRQGENSATVSN
jgi:choline dehydrogenase-like flavoprotein